MTRTVIAIRHIHFEDLGTLEPLLQKRGYTVHYVDATVDDLSAVDTLAPDLLVVLGGPIGAFDDGIHPFLVDELAVVQRRLAAGLPIMGICLGAQLIARALGAKVYALGVKEIGFSPVQLTEGGRASVLAALGDTPVLHWHGDQFDIPDGAEWLARTEIGENQAFSRGATVLGLQFHLEADIRQIERWLVGHACELGQAGIDPRTLRAQALAQQDRLAAAATAVVGAWLDGIDKPVGGSAE
ncbi:glutamine amidotransferase [Acidovorax sp. SDU_ACID1]|uniref:glutamine amidotransferase n=1 Tax=Acidovorax sp. SDU_ACID1 TaxID=3136632 RepID=UPI003872FE64